MYAQKKDYSFIKNILINTIGSLIDNFIAQNTGNKLNVYITDSLVRGIVQKIQESESKIIKALNENSDEQNDKNIN